MSKKKLLMIFLISGSSFLIGCENLPEAPQVKRCGLVKADGEGNYYLYCADSKTNEKHYLTIEAAHAQGTVCTSVEDYIEIQNYIKKLIEKYNTKE
jgi:hypothetical protein